MMSRRFGIWVVVLATVVVTAAARARVTALYGADLFQERVLARLGALAG